MLIYKITNKINNKIYIGQTTRNLELRWKDYIRETKIPKKCKVYNLVLEKYKYLTNTVPSSNNLEKV